MKTLKEITQQLEHFEKEFGIPVVNAEQGGDTWFLLKLGVISASNASKVVAKLDSDTRHTYLCELVGQVCTGLMNEELSSKAISWGKDHEDAARSCYEFSTGHTMTQLPFVFKDGLYREGCSPDGIVTVTKGAEIKCPFNTAHFIKFATEDKIKSEYDWQVQFTMRVMGADEWDVVQYDPRMKSNPLKTITVKRDAEKQKKFDDLVPRFIEDMDDMLKTLGVRFGDQWRRISPEQKLAIASGGK